MPGEAISLGMLLNFLNQNKAQPARAPDIRSLMLPLPPGTMERSRNRRDMADAAEKIGGIYGQAPTMKDVAQPYQMSPDETMEGEAPIQGLEQIVQQLQPGTGVYNQNKSQIQRLQELNQRLIGSQNPLLAAQGLKNMGGMQSSLMDLMKPSAQGLSIAAKMAGELGYKPGTPEWNKFINDYAAKKQYADPMDDPFNTNELTKWMTPGGKSVTYGTPRMAQEGKIILRNAMPKEGAGTTAMIDTALKYVDTIKANMYDADGNINKRAIQDMFVKDVATDLPLGTIGDVISNAAMSPKGQLVSNAFEFGIQGITRIETGAAMPDSELGNTRSRFIPRPFEDDAVSNQKVEAYVYFLKNAKQLIRPLMVEGTNYKGEDGYLNQEGVAIVNQAIDKAFLETAPGGSNREWKEGDGPRPGLFWEAE